MIKYFSFFPYYLQHLSRLLDGKSNGNPKTNGEYKLLKGIFENIVNPSLIDVGANIGEYSKTFLKYIKSNDYKHYLFEPNIHLYEKLKLSFNEKSNIYNYAVGDKNENVNFYFKSDLNDNGQNSLIKHYYLDKKTEIKMITLDSFLKTHNISNINFIKIDVEGFDFKVLEGTSESLKKGIIDFIQIEYSQQWIEVGGSIKKMLDFINKLDYSLYRIKSNKLIKIDYYTYLLEDYVYCNFLISKNDKKLPMKLSKLPPLPLGV